MHPARAVRIREPGYVDVLEIVEITADPPGPGEVRVAVAAAGVNRADLMQRRGLYPAPAGAPADIPGLEYAGTIESVGTGVTGWSPGDRVMGIVGGGAMATALCVHHRELVRVPHGMSLTDAAAIPEVFFTAWDALFVQAGITPGDVALVHAVGSGVGTAAVQLCSAAGIATVGTSRTADKLGPCTALGMSHGITVTDGRFADQVMAFTQGRGADVVIDPVGGAYVAEDLRALAPRGRVVMLGAMGGATAEVPMGLLMFKRATVLGSVLRSRPLEEKATLAQDFSRHVLPWFEQGRVRPVVDAVLPMARVAEAHTRMENNNTLGKLVLTWETA